MKYLTFLLILFTFSACSLKERDEPKYPGTDLSSDCHGYWRQGDTDLDIAKCEHDSEYPKFKRGQTVKSKNYAKSCNVKIVANHNWAYRQKESLYRVKVYCGKQSMHDSQCENGNLISCPEELESDLYSSKKS